MFDASELAQRLAAKQEELEQLQAMYEAPLTICKDIEQHKDMLAQELEAHTTQKEVEVARRLDGDVDEAYKTQQKLEAQSEAEQAHRGQVEALQAEQEALRQKHDGALKQLAEAQKEVEAARGLNEETTSMPTHQSKICSTASATARTASRPSSSRPWRRTRRN